MRRGKPVMLACLRWVLVYGALLALWPVLGETHAAAFRGTGNIVLGTALPGCTIRYRQATGGHAYADSEVVIRNRTNDVEGKKPISTRYRGYFPVAMLVALIIAAPVSWPRRGRALVLGLPLLVALIAARELVILLEAISAENPVASVELPSLVRSTLVSVATPLSLSVTSSFVVPVVVWLAVTFRGEDWAHLTPLPLGGVGGG